MIFFLIGCSIFVKESPKGFSNKGNQYANTAKEANPLDTGWGYCTCAVCCPSWGLTHRSHDLALFRSQTHILEWSSQVPQWDSSICLSLQIRCVWSKEAVKDGGLVWKKNICPSLINISKKKLKLCKWVVYTFMEFINPLKPWPSFGWFICHFP